ncbi:hypothetical protein FB451DRAFT_1183123 [Mycena latifolia]|nr:hypothetical protein FB451DRAFT_1183123 [Mycena latifolia]
MDAPQTDPDILVITPSPTSSTSRLPSELLADIFAIYWLSLVPAIPSLKDTPYTSAPEAIQRLAHAPLLKLSRVCSRWHAVALGTPSLWCDIQLDTALWRTSSHTDVVIGLLRSALERSGASSLTVKIIGGDDALPLSPVLELLATESERWQTLELSGPLSFIEALSRVNGRLPRLEILELHMWDDESTALDILAVLPRLQRLVFSGPPGAIPAVAVERLSSLSWVALPEDAPMAMSLLPNLKRSAEFLLELDMWNADTSDPRHLNLPPITSNIARVGIKIDNPQHHLLGGETGSSGYPMRWPHPQFLGFAERSGFHAHLISLQLFQSELTHTEFLECLSTLPALERLALSDNPFAPPGGPDAPLITDALFAHLTPTTDSPPIVPRLRSIRLYSLLLFTDTTYLAFVLSRVHCQSPSSPPFESHLCWLPGYHRKLNRNVLARMTELRYQKQLVFTFLVARAET